MKKTAIMLFLISLSCQRAKEPFENGINEEKPTSTAGSQFSQFTKTDSLPPIFKISYKATLRPVKDKGLNLINCKGNIDLSIVENMGQEMSGELDCGVIKKDISTLGADKNYLDTDFKNYPKSNLLTRKANTENVSFIPPRIYMLTPLIQDTSVFIPDPNDLSKNFSYTESTELSINGPSGLSTLRGQTSIKVLREQKYESENFPEPVDVIVYEVTNTGFENLDPNLPLPGGSLFRKMTFYYSSRPIMIPRIEIIMTLNEIPGEKDSKFTNFITTVVGNGELKMVLDMVKYEPIQEREK